MTLEATGKVCVPNSQLEKIACQLGAPTLDFIQVRNFYHMLTIMNFGICCNKH